MFILLQAQQQVAQQLLHQAVLEFINGLEAGA
jgi:hypothetical protein